MTVFGVMTLWVALPWGGLALDWWAFWRGCGGGSMFLFGDRVGGLWLYGRVADVQVPGETGVSARDDSWSVGGGVSQSA